MFERLDKNSIEVKKFQFEETKIILQRHEDYDRDSKSETAGHLFPEAVEKAHAESRKRIKNIIEQVSPQERKLLFFLVLSSDTTYGTGARSIETGRIIIEEIKKALKENGINEDNLLNVSHVYKQTEKGEPRSMAQIREPLMFENTPEFVAFLKEKYPERKDFWKAYEADIEKEQRLQMGAEGPEDMANRLESFLALIKRYSQFFYRVNPGSRLIVWCISHYDTISPWTKKYVLKEKVTEKNLPVDYGAGLTVGINKDGKAITEIGGEEFEIEV